MRILGIIIVILTTIVIGVVGGCLSDKESQAEIPVQSTDKISTEGSSKTRVNSEAGVTITAVNLGNNTFNITLDTHSGSLDYEMANISYIRDSKGNIIKPESWDGGIGGHHFEGTLKFQKFGDNNDFELVIQDVAGIKERVLKW